MHKRIIVGIACASVCCLFIFFLVQKYDSISSFFSPKKTGPCLEKPTPCIVIQDVQIHEKDKQQRYDVTVSAHEGRFYYPQAYIEASEVTCNIQKDGHDIGSLHATLSSIDQNKKNAFFPGLVQGNLKNLLLTSHDIFYDIALNKAFTSQPTSCKHPQFTMLANQVTIDFSDNSLYLQKGVYSEFLYNATSHKSGN